MFGVELSPIETALAIAGTLAVAVWTGVKAVAWVVAYFKSINTRLDRAHEKIDGHVDQCGPRYHEIASELKDMKVTIEAHRKEAAADAATTRRELGARIGDLTKAVLDSRRPTA